MKVTLKLGNGASVAAKAIGSTSVDLLDHILLLDDCRRRGLARAQVYCDRDTV